MSEPIFTEDNYLNERNKVLSGDQSDNNTDEILKEILSYEAPKPSYDPNREEELKRIARLNTFSKGVGVLGDVLSSSVGGNVNQKAPDKTNYGLLQNYHNYIDNYSNRKDDWNYRNWMSKIQQAVRGDEIDFRNKKFEVDQEDKKLGRELQRDQLESTKEYHNSLATERDRQFELDKRRMDLETKKPYVQHEMQMKELDERLNNDLEKYQIKLQHDGKYPVLYDDNGKQVRILKPGEKEKILSFILSDNDPKISNSIKKDIEQFYDLFGDRLNSKHMDILIGKYWDKSPQVLQYLGMGQQQQQINSNDTIQSKWGSYVRK